MTSFESYINMLDSAIGGSNWFVYLLLGTGVFFTFYLKFPQIRYFRHAIRIARGKYDNPEDKGDTTHFQSLTTALSGTVGTGNIAGVAFAIHLGGPAALFWMWVTAFLGMGTKFVEVLLSHKYREIAKDGSISGGPMYYMKNKLNMKWLATLFAIATIFSSFGTGSMPQINSISNAIYATTGIDHIITGGVLAVLLALVILGGIKRIAKVTERLVPIMAAIYIIGALVVIFSNANNIVPSVISIFSDIFTGSAATGGFLGATLSFAFNKGVNRGLFSNEAGQGSAPIAHAAAKAKEPVSEGMVAILEPFIDTIIICTLTGLVLLSTGTWNKKTSNTFIQSDVTILDNNCNKDDIFKHLSKQTKLKGYTGQIEVINGSIQDSVIIIHARSIAENILVLSADNQIYNGEIEIKEGLIKTSNIILSGHSLIHSAPLTSIAFTKSVFGDWGKYIVSIGLLLFAFSTAISWSYYGDRATTFLWGSKAVPGFRILYIIGFFIASFMDTPIIWTISGITVAFMTVPNLIGILILHKDVKGSIRKYWKNFKS